MTIHYFDILGYIIMCIILWFILPEDFKFEMGALYGFMIWIVCTIIYCIVFSFIDMIDLFGAINFHINFAP